MIRFVTVGAIAFLVLAAGLASAQSIVADHHSANEFDAIPAGYFDTVRDQYNFFYGHTSHGSQITSGLTVLEQIDSDLYADVTMSEILDDLGHNGDLSWVQPTRDYLDGHPDCNAVMWSWCGGASDNSAAGIDIYLQAMTHLETDYPDVVFIYMTGHLDGTGPEGNLYQRNNQIRQYCELNNKVLFDFADIESYDPDTTWYPNEDDGCDWCAVWCGTNDCPDCWSCAHSHCFNCYRKGRAFWWMMAQVAGWQAPTPAPDAPHSGLVLAPNRPNPFNPATTIAFTVPRATNARVTVLDSRGRLVAELMDGVVDSGSHEVNWQGRDKLGRAVPSGNYFYRLETNSGRLIRKMTLLK